MQLSSPPTLQGVLTAWDALRAVVPVTSISSDEEYVQMAALANRLIDWGAGDETHPLAGLLSLVGDALSQWEEQHAEIEEATPAEVLRELMAEHDLRQADLADLLSQGQLSMILAGKRGISKALAKKLGQRFGVSPAVFI